MGRQGAAIGLARRGRGPRLARCRAWRLALDLLVERRHALLDVLEPQRQLIGIEPLRARTEAMAPQRRDHRLQAIACRHRRVALGGDRRDLGHEPRPLLGEARAAADQQRLERVGVGREFIAKHREDRCTQSRRA